MSKTVIAAASFYKQKFFFNPDFNALPSEIKKEIKEAVIGAAEKSRGIFTIGINEGDIFFETGAAEEDLNYDEIEGKLQINSLEKDKADLLKKLCLWYKFKEKKVQ